MSVNALSPSLRLSSPQVGDRVSRSKHLRSRTNPLDCEVHHANFGSVGCLPWLSCGSDGVVGCADAALARPVVPPGESKRSAESCARAVAMSVSQSAERVRPVERRIKTHPRPEKHRLELEDVGAPKDLVLRLPAELVRHCSQEGGSVSVRRWSAVASSRRPSFSATRYQATLKRCDSPFQHLATFSTLTKSVATLMQSAKLHT